MLVNTFHSHMYVERLLWVNACLPVVACILNYSNLHQLEQESITRYTENMPLSNCKHETAVQRHETNLLKFSLNLIQIELMRLKIHCNHTDITITNKSPFPPDWWMRIFNWRKNMLIQTFELNLYTVMADKWQPERQTRPLLCLSRR